MKNSTLLIGGGGVILAVLLLSKKTANAKSELQRGKDILSDPSNLEGYFSVGSHSSVGSCCNSCASGGPCSG